MDSPHTCVLSLAPISEDKQSVSWAAVLAQEAEPLLPFLPALRVTACPGLPSQGCPTPQAPSLPVVPDSCPSLLLTFRLSLNFLALP